MKIFATSTEPDQHAHMCSLTRLYTVGSLNQFFILSRKQFAALCHYFIVFLESIIEALILLMINKFTYIKTIVLLFLCIYNTQHAEFTLFYLKHVAKQNLYNYVKINIVFTPNSRGLWCKFAVRPACTSIGC